MAVNVIQVGDFLEEAILEEKVVFSDSITQNWTEQALECYRLKCDCSNCSVAKGNYSFVCQMPKVIDALTKSLGAPVSKPSLVRVK